MYKIDNYTPADFKFGSEKILKSTCDIICSLCFEKLSLKKHLKDLKDMLRFWK